MEILTFETIKNQYFYRTEKWDWLNETMIHVYDSRRPRMITMDPWPQEVFLDAKGEVTVKQYIQDFYYRYPEGKAPDGLKENIMEVLNGLIVEEGIVKLSDIPITLDEAILKPLRDQGTIDMLGTWKGTYTYSIPDELKDDRLKEVGFTIQITSVQGSTFTGTVEDDQNTGGTPGVGKITGRFTDYTVQFDKEMPVYSHLDKNGNHIQDSSRKHPTIVYKGEFGGAKQYCLGTWHFKKKVLVWRGIIPVWASGGSGRFSMSKVKSE